MANTAILAIKIIADAANAQKGLDATATSVEKAQKSLGKMVVPAAAALTGIVALGTAAVKSASDQQQAFGALEAVYGKNADQVKKLAAGAATQVGLASADYAQLAAVLGAQLKGMGTAADELVPKTDELIGVGADLAATFGGTTADAVAAVSSLLRGERDPIEKYGIAIKQSDINAQLAAQGLGKLEGAAKTQAEAQATLTLLTQQSADAHGQFARESDSAAGASQTAAAQFENTKATLGTALLPVVATAAGMLGNLALKFGDNTTAIQIAIGVVAALSAGILVANVALKAYIVTTKLWEAAQKLATAASLGTRLQLIALQVQIVAVTAAQKITAAASKAWAAAQWLVNAALTANPIGIVVVAIAALVAGLILAYKHSETFRRIVDAAFKAVKDAAQAAFSWITGNWSRLQSTLTAPFTVAWDVISGIIEKIRSAVASISSAIRSIPVPKIPHIPGLNTAPAGYAYTAAPAEVARVAGPRSTATARAGSTSGGVVINIHGAIDPDATARQIRRLLDRADVRAGRRAPYSRSFATP